LKGVRARRPLLAGGILCVATLLAACVPGDPGGGLAVTRINGQAAVELPVCRGANLTSLSVWDDDHKHVLWELQAIGPQLAETTYVLGVVPPGYRQVGTWTTQQEQQELEVSVFIGGVHLVGVDIALGKVSDSRLYMGGKVISRKTLNSQIYCASK